MIKIYELLFEQDSSATVDVAASLEPFKKQLDDIKKTSDETAKNLLLVQKGISQKQQTPTNSKATTGTTQLSKATPSRAAGTQGSIGTDKKQDTVTSGDLKNFGDELENKLLGAIEQSKK